jgi:tRNA-dihydrouridine synthase
MRKHAAWYLKGFDGAAAFRKRLGEATSLVRFSELLDDAENHISKNDNPNNNQTIRIRN